MSNVTNVIFSCSLFDVAILKTVNKFFANGQGFRLVPKEVVGGNKYLEASVAIGAFNRLPLGALVDYIRQLGWREPDSVQLFVMEQEDERFTLIQPHDSDLGSLVGKEFDTNVVRRRHDLVCRHCGPYLYRPIPVRGFDDLRWKDQVRVRVRSVDHLAKEMSVDVRERKEQH